MPCTSKACSTASAATRQGQLLMRGGSWRMCVGCSASAGTLGRADEAGRAAAEHPLRPACIRTHWASRCPVEQRLVQEQPWLLLAAIGPMLTRRGCAWITRRPTNWSSACAVAVACQPLAQHYVLALGHNCTFRLARCKAGARAPASFHCECCRVLKIRSGGRSLARVLGCR